jgi:hypothetical protein
VQQKLQPPRKLLIGKEIWNSRVEEVPCPIAQPHELFLLPQLAAGTVAPLAEWAPPGRGWTVAQWRAGPLLVLCSPAPLAPATRFSPHHVACERGRGCRGLVAAIMDEFGEEFGSTACNLDLSVFGRAVFPRSA